MIDLLRQAVGSSSCIVNVDSLHAVSEQARKGSIAALTNQFQRMMQAAPIGQTSVHEAVGAEPSPGKQKKSERCTGSLSTTERSPDGHRLILCSSVGCCAAWNIKGLGIRASFPVRIIPKNEKSMVAISHLSIIRQHCTKVDHWDQTVLLCPLCALFWDYARDFAGFLDHLRNHSLLELCEAFELLPDEHGTDPSSYLSLNCDFIYCCLMSGCHFEVSVEDVRDTKLEAWDGRLEIFRHKHLGYNWRLLAQYLLSFHVQVLNSDTITFKCPICGMSSDKTSDKRIALQLFLGHIKVHDPEELLGIWNESVHDYCTCRLPSGHESHDPGNETAIGAIELVSKADIDASSIG